MPCPGAIIELSIGRLVLDPINDDLRIVQREAENLESGSGCGLGL
jgi:hypothetical protein